MFHRDFVQRHDKALLDFFDVYFTVMRSYANDRTRLLTDMAQSTHLQREVVENILQKIDWYDLFENAEQQFGLTTSADATATDGLVKTIIACTDVLRRTGSFPAIRLRGTLRDHQLQPAGKAGQARSSHGGAAGRQSS